MSIIRLDRYIANQTGLSRNESKEMLKSLRVTVNGKMEKNYDAKINTETDVVCLDGSKISYSEFVYILMNKPKGVLTATEDKNQKTVLDLVPADYKRKNLAPVGRLDKDTTGLLLITDDGQFSHKVISPKSDIKKVYRVVLDGPIPDNASEEFSKGIVLADGTKCLPAKLQIEGENQALVEIREGKYHQIKRMFGVLDLGVVELKRLKVGGFSLPDDLREGECRELTEAEISSILY